MYTVDALDRVIPLDDFPRSDVGAPCPLVLGDDSSTLVAYGLPDIDHAAAEPLTDGIPADGEPMAIVHFARRMAHIFGLPNDEAFSGHPLASRGLRPYGAFRVEQSSWLRALERRNAVHRSHRPAEFFKYTHFILSFHDSTFECIALRAEVFSRFVRTAFVVSTMTRLLKRGPGASDLLG